MDADLRTTFDEDPVLYDRCRPTYPAELIAEVRSQIPELGGKILELGPGTGQATGDLAASGAVIIAVELGPALAAFMRDKFATTPNVSVVTGAFEHWRAPEGERFDLVLACTSWHWLDAEMRSDKVADLLAPGGALATVTTHHIAGGTSDFFVDVQDCYERFDPATPPGLRLTEPADLPPTLDEVDRSDLFLPATRNRFEQDVTSSTAEYLDLLCTYSNHRALPEQSRTGLLACIGDLLDRRYGGRVTKRYLYELRVALRR